MNTIIDEIHEEIENNRRIERRIKLIDALKTIIVLVTCFLLLVTLIFVSVQTMSNYGLFAKDITVFIVDNESNLVDGYHAESFCMAREEPIRGCSWNMSDTTCLQPGKCKSYAKAYVANGCQFSKWDKLVC